MALERFWPLFGLRVTTPQLELWVPTDGDLEAIADLASRGVHDPSFMPFTIPWTDAEPGLLEQGMLQYWWRCRGNFSPTQWDFGLAVSHKGTVIGCQNLSSTDFPTLRVAETGSWLGLEHQGKGFGKEMRRAMLHVAFEHLGASAIVSSAYIDNPSSQGVSRAVGYEENGYSFALRRGRQAEKVHFRITRERWLETRTDMPIEVTGWDGCAALFGLEQGAE